MRRILVIGSGGAGKSTLAVRLGEKLGLPVVHLDRLYWYGDWQHLDNDAFDKALAAELEKPAWVMDGNYGRTLPWRLACCDTVIYLDYPVWTCLRGVIRRAKQYRGAVRPDMGGQCTERVRPEFLRWILSFRRKKRPAILKLLEQAGTDVKAYRFTCRRQAESFLQCAENQS